MVKSLVERRMVLRGAGVAGATVLAAAAVPAEASAHPEHHGLLGAWRITHTDNPPSDTTPVAAVVTFGAGGVFVDQDIAPVAPAGVGAWTAHGDRFEVTFWTGSGDTPADAATVRVRVHGMLHGDRISGTYRVTGFAGASTTVVLRSTGTFSGWRIVA